MSVLGSRHLGWSHPSQKLHIVTTTWTGTFGDDDVLTARSDCGSPVTSVLEQTQPEMRGNLCRRCAKKAPELTGVNA